jgi:hypothetical protein
MGTEDRYVIRTPSGEFVGGGAWAVGFCPDLAGARRFGSPQDAERFKEMHFTAAEAREYRVFEVTPDGQFVPA